MSNSETTGGQRVAAYLLLVATTGPLTVGGLLAASHLSRLTCRDSTTFLSGTTEPSLRLVGVLFLAMGGGYLAVRGLIRTLPALTWIAGYPKAYAHASKPRSMARLWLYLATASVLIGLILVSVASFAAFCLGQSGIVERSGIWSDPVRHEWSSVVAIQTGCSRGGRGSWHGQYFLVTADGAAIDLFTAEPDFADGYPGLVRALRGRPFAFDSRYVAKDCGHMDARYLLNPPR